MDERAICTEQDLDEGETDLRRTVWHTDGVLDTSCHSVFVALRRLIHISALGFQDLAKLMCVAQGLL